MEDRHAVEASSVEPGDRRGDRPGSGGSSGGHLDLVEADGAVVSTEAFAPRAAQAPGSGQSTVQTVPSGGGITFSR